MDTKMLNAKIVVEFLAQNICEEEVPKEDGMSLEEIVRFLIKEEGLFGIVEDDFQVMSVTGYTERGK